jgi:glycosyltransferase involved in cell wall biosynthesis
MSITRTTVTSASADSLGTAVRAKVVVASGVHITHLTPAELADRPIQDFTILGQLYDVTLIDSLVAVRGRPSRFVARWSDSSWVVAYRTVRAARRADAIIAMGDDVGVPTALMKFLFRRRTPMVMICHHMRSRRVRVLFGRFGLHRYVQRFFAMSTTMRDVMVNEHGIPADRIELLFDTVDHRFFRPDENVDPSRQIASVGVVLRDYKTLLAATRGLDVDVKIEANSAWYDQPVNFEPTDLHDRAELCNDGTTLGLRDIYAASAMVVVPLLDIGQSAGYTSILEGMAMCKPVISTRLTMMGDFIRDGETGFLVPPQDVEALRDRIVTLLENPDLATRMGAAGRRAVEAHYTRDHFRDKLAAGVERAMQTR